MWVRTWPTTPGSTSTWAGAGSLRGAPVLHTIATFHSSAADPEGAPDLMLWISDPAGDPPELWIEAVLLKPHARGRVRLRSADPADPPLIELPVVGDPADVDRLAEGYRRAWEVATRPELRSLCAEPVSPDIGAAGDLHALVRENAYSVPHTVGTCSMGTVVDAAGRVHGTECLSVIDGSIIPAPPSGFPHVIAIMIAERLAELIVRG